MSLFKRRVGLLEALRKPQTPGYAPLCMTCGRYVDSYQLVEGYPGESVYARVLARHHGAEELATFDMGSTNWNEETLASHLRGHAWFAPNLVEK